MKILRHKNIEFTEVILSDLYNDRIDAEYYKPEFIRNSSTIESKEAIEVKELMYSPQYGLSIAMNESEEGFKILKMDDIVGILADDINAKYADVSNEIFQNYELKKFDVLFNRVNSDEFVGRTGIYLLDGKHTFASYLVRITSEYSYQNCYLTVFLNCKYGYNSLQRVKRRAVNQANINAQELKALKIPIPTVSFQKQIEILVLESYEQKLKAEIINKEAEQILLKALDLEDWQTPKRTFYIKNVEFEGEDSVAYPNFSELMRSNRIDAEYWQPKYIEIEDKIKSYKNGYACLGDIVTSISSGEYSEKYFPKSKDTVFYLRNANLKKGKIEADINFSVEPSNFRKIARKNDILTARVGAIGVFGVISEELEGSVFSDNILCLRLKK